MSDETLIERIRTLYETPLAPEPTALAPELDPIDGIKAVLFDVYGTLLISASGDIGLAGDAADGLELGQLLASAGLDAPSAGVASLDSDVVVRAAIEAEHERARARGIDYPEVDILAVWEQILGTLDLKPTPEQLGRVALEHECRSNVVWPMPGLAETLAELRAAGLVLGIVSNAQFYTPLILEAFLGRPPAGLGLEPECSAWSYRLGIAKPSPVIFRPALEGLQRKHGISPEQTLYVGNDRRNDIWPAGQLGLRTALFAGDARSLRLRDQDHRLDTVRPDRIITELAQIPGLL
ncbi:MAG: HAD family hydrolase [Gammaproteobacteria bacterium]|jgi:putative hydrolase of the HAD superfamily|nr:HAD family hydrolase [Gammaproteobacteria bacterium]